MAMGPEIDGDLTHLRPVLPLHQTQYTNDFLILPACDDVTHDTNLQTHAHAEYVQPYLHDDDPKMEK